MAGRADTCPPGGWACNTWRGCPPQGDFETLKAYVRKLSVDAYMRKKAAMEDFEPGLITEAERWGLGQRAVRVQRAALARPRSSKQCGPHWPMQPLAPAAPLRARRYFVLTNTDSLWKEHLQAIKFLQQAVGLRGYAAKDPLIEFKLEG